MENSEKISGYAKEILAIIEDFKKSQAGVLNETSPQKVNKQAIILNGQRARLGQIVAELGTEYQSARASRKQAWASSFSALAIPGSVKGPDGIEVKKITTGEYCKARADISTFSYITAEIKAEELLEKAKALREDLQEALYLFQSYASNILRENSNTGSIYGQDYKPRPGQYLEDHQKAQIVSRETIQKSGWPDPVEAIGGMIPGTDRPDDPKIEGVPW